MLIVNRVLKTSGTLLYKDQSREDRKGLALQLMDWLTILSKIFQVIWQPSFACEKYCLFQGDF